MRKDLQLNEVAKAMAQMQMMMQNSLRSSYRGDDIYSQADTKHPQAWRDYGYPKALNFWHHYLMYKRNGIAKSGIELIPDKCWGAYPAIVQGRKDDNADERGRNSWENSVDDLFDDHSIWQKLHEADKKQRVHEYSAFIIQVRGNAEHADWSQPLGRITATNIAKIFSVYDEQLKPVQWETNKNSIRYGLPTMYQFDECAIDALDNIGNSTKVTQDRSVQIHWTRVITFAEGDINDGLRGEPANEAGYNDLLTMSKIVGAGGEGFWKNAAMKLFFKVDGDSELPDKNSTDPSEVEAAEAMDDQISDFVEMLDKFLALGSMDAKVLSAQLDDPESPFMVAGYSYAASVKTPLKKIIGNQTGERAATDDGDEFNTMCQSRCENYCTGGMINRVIDWMIEHGVIKPTRYHVEWPDLLAPSDMQKAELLDKIANAAQKLVVFGQLGDINEFRSVLGWSAVAETEMPEDDNDDDIGEGLEDGQS